MRRIVLAVALAVALSGCSRGCGEAARQERADAAAERAERGVLSVPRAGAPPKLDGELTEPDWQTAARTGGFTEPGGEQSRPFSEVKVLWDDQNLYLGLYAADQDIEAHVTEHDSPVWTDDAFLIRLGDGAATAADHAIDISAAGVTADAKVLPGGKLDGAWESGVRLAVDKDGTVNDASDEDEEWVVEAAVPFSSLGIVPKAGTRIQFEVSRCDTPKRAQRRCAAWGHDPRTGATSGRLVLEGPDARR